jgi:phosphatidate cytidylyltransferase
MPIQLNLPGPVQWTLLGIFAVLSLSSLCLLLLRRLKPASNFKEVGLRIRTWWLMAGIFTTAIVIGPAVSIVFFAFVSFMAFKEYISLIPTRRADRRVLFWAYLAIPMQYWFVHTAWYGMFIIFIPVYVFLLLPMRMIAVGDTAGFLKAIGTLHWGLMTTVFSISHLAFLLALPPEGNIAGGAGLILFLVILTQGNDVSQFLWGKSFGKRKIVPTVSPNKTWAGFLGGVFNTTVLALLLAGLLTPMSLPYAAAAGVLIAVSGFFGDTVISAVKRDIGVKDSGDLLPGHGGILDRVDSLTYTAPLFFHFIHWFYY